MCKKMSVEEGWKSLSLGGEKNLSGSSNHTQEYTYFRHYPHFPLNPKIFTFLRNLIELKF